MTGDYQVQISGLAGSNWRTVCRGPEPKAREVFLKQLRVYTVGRFRLLNPEGQILDERKARPLFSDN